MRREGKGTGVYLAQQYNKTEPRSGPIINLMNALLFTKFFYIKLVFTTIFYSNRDFIDV